MSKAKPVPGSVEQQISQLSDEDLQAIKKEIASLREEKFANLASTINGKLQTRMGYRKQKENQWLESMRLYLGSLSSYNIVTADYPFGYPNGNERTNVHRPEYNIVRNKCNLAMAQTITNQFAAGDKNWALKAPPVCDMDPQDYAQSAQQMMQAAAQKQPQTQNQQQQQQQPQQPPQPPTPDEVCIFRADLMEKEIENHLIECKYGMEMRAAMADRVILGTGVIKGPKNAGKQKKIYVKQMTSDQKPVRVPKYVTEKVPSLYRVNLWFWFPDETATEICQAEDSIEVHPMTKTDLIDLAKHPGFYPDQIEPCLDEEPRQYTNSPFNDPAYLTQGINTLKNKYLVLEYHGPLKKDDLKLMGIEDLSESPLDEIYGEVWVCNNRIIRIDLEDIEGSFSIPYKVCVWEPDPATVFGFGIPMLTRDQQRVVNEAYKMILDNAGVSAGPQVIVDTTLIKPADGGMACTPWKVWYSTEFGADTSKAITFFTPPNSFEGLSQLLTMAREFADDESSINTLIGGGMNSPQAADGGATGLMIMNQNATAPLFFKAEEWDDKITYPVIQDMYDWEMQYNPKDEVKGNFEVDVRTSTSYLRGLVEQQKLQQLFQEIAQGSPLGEWVNMDVLMEARLASMKLPYEGIVKTPQQVMQERANKPPAPPDPNMLKAQAEMMKVQVEGQRLQLDQQTAATDQQNHMQEAQMQYQAQMRTDVTRDNEARASQMKAYLDFQTAMAQLASQDKANNARITADLMKTQAQLQADKFFNGMEFAARAKDQALKGEELKIKKKQGSGVTGVR